MFISERGSRFEEQHFDSEDAACTYFLKCTFELDAFHSLAGISTGARCSTS